MSLFKKNKTGPVIKTWPLQLHWDTEDPFIFVSHHCDNYPKGNAQQAPPLKEISGRNLGRDYKERFGFRMYNGKVVPGFPLHAHWGYETITIPELGFIDHFDCLGNQGRYGFGYVHWLTAGSRYQHNEMYPLAYSDKENPNDITQIMINLPLKNKGTKPEFKMMWSEKIPIIRGEGYSVKIIAGSFNGIEALAPSDISWAADPKHHVNIMLIKMIPNSKITLPAISTVVNRNLYFITGNTITIGKETIEYSKRIKLDGNTDICITNGDKDSTLWFLEGEPIKEKTVSFGPVNLETEKEVRIAIDTIRKEEFKNWPWDVIDKAQPIGTERFVRYADGTEEHPSQ